MRDRGADGAAAGGAHDRRAVLPRRNDHEDGAAGPMRRGRHGQHGSGEGHHGQHREDEPSLQPVSCAEPVHGASRSFRADCFLERTVSRNLERVPEADREARRGPAVSRAGRGRPGRWRARRAGPATGGGSPPRALCAPSRRGTPLPPARAGGAWRTGAAGGVRSQGIRAGQPPLRTPRAGPEPGASAGRDATAPDPVAAARRPPWPASAAGALRAGRR